MVVHVGMHLLLLRFNLQLCMGRECRWPWPLKELAFYLELGVGNPIFKATHSVQYIHPGQWVMATGSQVTVTLRLKSRFS